MRSLIWALAASLALAATPAAAGSYLRVASWNTLHAGWNGSTNWNGYAAQVWSNFGTSGTSPNGVDVVFAQEVMYADAAASIAAALRAASGVNWDYRVTDAIGRSSYKERYAVFFRPDRVQLLSATVWNDTGDVFEREPQVVRLRQIDTGADFTFINWHTVFGTTAGREAEVRAIATVFNSLQASSSTDQDVVLLGDHNRDATSPWWSNLTSLSPTVGWKVNDKTSINTSCGYANAYDHFWFQSGYVTEFSSAGRDYIGDLCAFRNGLSDHAPINLTLYATSDTD
jgi:hypothetical protein